MYQSQIQLKIPTRFHIGTQKAGSTFLYNLLKSHQNIALSTQSEVHYYYKHLNKGEVWYKNLFKSNDIQIDTSPKYFMNGEVVAPRIQEACGAEARLLLILRNPIDLINSHYQMHVTSGYFSKHKDMYPTIPTDLTDCVTRYPEYIKRALYYEQLQVWLRYFDKSQIKVFIFEEFVHDVNSHIQELLDFWNIPQQKLTVTSVSKNRMLKNSLLFVLRGYIMQLPRLKQFLQKNRFANYVYDHFLTHTSSSSISHKERVELCSLFKNDVYALQEFLESPVSIWKDFKAIHR